MQVETERAIIRSFNKNDIPEYAKIVTDPEVMKYIADGKTQSFEEAKQYIEDVIAFERINGYSRYAVINKNSAKLMGFCGYKIFNDDLDFGWRYSREYWNQGYGIEKAKKVFEYGKSILKFNEIVCISYPENKGSVKIIEKLGMKYFETIKLYNKDVLKYIWKRWLPKKMP